MIYLALTFWLMVGLLEAYAIFKLFEGLVRPRWINLVLLPGTIVAELAHFLAALLTGAPVREAKLVSDESVGQSASEPAVGIPVLSPLLMALLPIVSGLAIIVLLYHSFDDSTVNRFALASGSVEAVTRPLHMQLTQQLYWSLGAWFRIPQDMLALAERLLAALPMDSRQWQPWVFIYLTACLSIRMVPLRGNLRGGMAAVVLVGGLSGLLSLAVPQLTRRLESEIWSLLAYVIALLTLLLLVALLARGGHALFLTLRGKPAPKRPADRRQVQSPQM